MVALEADKTEKLEKIATVEKELEERKETNKAIYKDKQKAEKKHGKVQNALMANKDKINDLEAKNAELHEEKKMNKKRKAELEKNLKKEEDKVNKFEEMPEKCAKDEEELDEKIEHLVRDEKNYTEGLQFDIESVEKVGIHFYKQLLLVVFRTQQISARKKNHLKKE